MCHYDGTKYPSAPVEEPTTAVESSQQPAAASRKGKNTGPVLARAIVLVIALGAGGYYHTHKQAQRSPPIRRCSSSLKA